MVDGIVLDLKDNLTLLKKFIASIHFCGGKTSVWVDKVEECVYFVEPSFADFGNPDLMLLCKCKKEKHLIFIEAKVSTYEDSSVDINDIRKYIGQAS